MKNGMRTVSLAAFLVVAALTSGELLVAQETVERPASDFLDPQNGVTEAELVARALTLNPTLAAERLEVEIAKGDVAQARLRKNPFLSVGGLKEVNGDDNRWSIGGSVPLELFGRRARRTEVAERKQDATHESFADRERLLAGEVRMRFGEALAAARNLMFAEQLLQVNGEFLKLMEDRVREGAAASLDAEEVRVEVNRIHALRIDYQTKAELSLLTLKEEVGLQPEETIRLKGSLQMAARTFDQKQLLQLALSHRPDLAFRRANEAMAAADLRQEQTEAKPDASFSAGYERPNSGFSQRAFDLAGTLRPIRQTFNYAVVGLEINLPVFNRNQGAIAADVAAIQSARSQIAAVDLGLRYEVTQTLVRLDGAQARVAAYRSGVRDQAARNLEVVRKTYSYGRNSLLDVIAEQRRYIDIETGYTDILLDAYVARVVLEQAVGTSLP
jgi:cobalt-zinc-cadmium efflux system outer membrane protein